MADPIYGIHQSQPRDVFDFLKSNGKRLDLVGRFSYLPLLLQKAESSIIGLPDGLEFVISDEILHSDHLLMDGRTLRYAKIRAYSLSFGAYTVEQSTSVMDEISRLGYQEMNVLSTSTNVGEIATLLGVNSAVWGASLPSGLTYAEFVAGNPRYLGNDESVFDAPLDGNSYNRLNGEWVQSTGLGNIDGGIATLY